MTAQEFADAVDANYSTVRAWLQKGWVPGAYRIGEGVRSIWQIPAAAVLSFKRPKPRGRPKKQRPVEEAS